LFPTKCNWLFHSHKGGIEEIILRNVLFSISEISILTRLASVKNLQEVYLNCIVSCGSVMHVSFQACGIEIVLFDTRVQKGLKFSIMWIWRTAVNRISDQKKLLTALIAGHRFISSSAPK